MSPFPRAEDVINTLISVYNTDAINDKNQIVMNTSNFINDRLIVIEKELGDVDSDIESYKREHQLTDISSETGMYLQTSSQYRQEGLSLENQLSLAKYIKNYLTDPGKSSDLIPANTGISDVNIESQIGEFNEMLLKRDKLISNSSSKNPVVQDLNNSLIAMKQTIIRSVDNLIVGLNIKIKNIRAQEEQTSRRISAVPTQQKEVLSVERRQKIKEELYLYLLNKREENELTQRMTESNARIIDPAAGSNAPVAPKSMMILLASIVLGCAIPAGVLWLLAVSDTKVRSRKDVEGVLSVPFLGEIPMRDKKDKSEVVVHENGRDSVSEAFRIVRTNMDFMRVKDKKMQVVMFTSFNPGAGKTFVSMNLAMSFALTHKKVVLVDLDIRKGTLSSHVRVSDKGVTNYLSGRIDNVDEIIRQNELCDKLDIIHAGPVPPNPAELLLGDRLETLIAELRKRYDYIILDNVPAGVVADAVAGLDDAAVEVGIHLRVLAQYEEGRLGIVLVQRRENPFGDAGRGAVVEGEVDGRPVLHLPDEVGHQPADEFRRFETHVRLEDNDRANIDKKYYLCKGGSPRAEAAARPVVRIASDAVRDLHHLCSERISVWTGRSPAPASARSSHKNV